MENKKYPEGWIVVDHIIPGVTAEMIDWWWVNMEKVTNSGVLTSIRVLSGKSSRQLMATLELSR